MNLVAIWVPLHKKLQDAIHEQKEFSWLGKALKTTQEFAFLPEPCLTTPPPLLGHFILFEQFSGTLDGHI